MTALAPGRGYTIGPDIPATELPWPMGWEQAPDVCGHRWECVLLEADGRHRVRVEEVVRCADCLAPRCGHSRDVDPCMLRRHHAPNEHRHLSGRLVPIGGYST